MGLSIPGLCPRRVPMFDMLWASALSGASGTALPWWWERLDERNHYPHYQPLARFVAEVAWSGGEVQPLTGTAADERVRVVGLRTRDRAWLWFFHREAAWNQVVTAGREPSVVTGIRFELEPWSGASARVEWWDTRSGEVVRSEAGVAGQGKVVLNVPDFSRDLACRVIE